MVDREVKEQIEAQTKMKKYSQNNRQGGKYNNYKDGNDEFSKGTAKPRNNYNNNQGGTWKQEDNQEKAKLRE